MFIFTLVYIVGGLLSYKWMDTKLPEFDDDDKIPLILWSLLWPAFWVFAMYNFHYR